MNILNLKDKYLIFDKETFSIYPIDKKMANELNLMNDAEQEEIFINIKSKNQSDSGNTKETDIQNNLKCSRLIIIGCQDCNLMCRYCYAQQGTYGESNINKYMNFETYKKSIEFILTKFPNGIHHIQFFGGEPLLNLNLIKEACEWNDKFFKNKNLDLPYYSIVTNGTIISDEIIDLFNKYHITVTISIDGNKEINDINRIYKNNNKSVFDVIEKNIQYINDRRDFSLNFEVTIDKANLEQYKSNKKLLDIEEILKFQPDCLHVLPAQWSTANTVDNNQAADQAYKNDFIDYFDDLSNILFDTLMHKETQLTSTTDLLDKIKNKKIKKNLCGAGITDFAISVEGDIYPCFVFTGIDKFKIGNVHTYKNYNNYESIRDNFKKITYSNIQKCSDCWANGLCHSCIGFNYLTSEDISIPSESVCECQKALIKRTLFKCSDLIIR